MIDSLWVLIAEVATVDGLQAVASPPVRSPMTTSDGEPKEDLNS
jgi:hypothetical protein